ncbi:butyrophilin subfamily 3 member A2-like isoform X2 [Echeneis naucrates]|uniref:butyrophilin subfamily 3 member A2-like isoform X2 n=1 Tax=Echeneis naucrates TaxID=173247 RepID=UPI001113AEFB|nr:butyrophilin subfamily 3 member A2-like isoform X2 [Echeneis naucrates]
MFGPKTRTLLSVSICLHLSLIGQAVGQRPESPIKVIAPGGNDVMLPCSLGMDIRSHSFDWAKDGLKVFVYTKSGYYLDMDKRFMERISHFKNQLQSGNASIMIQNTTMADSGNYTCNFPKLPQGQKTFHVELVVAVSPKPLISIGDITGVGVELKCRVGGAFPKPTLQWLDGDRNPLPAKGPLVLERGGCYNVTLQTVVTSPQQFCCVSKQANIVVEAQFSLPKELFDRGRVYMWIPLGSFLVVATVLALVQFFLIKDSENHRKKNPDQMNSSSRPAEEPRTDDHI